MSGTVAAQLLTFAATPMLTRLYTREAYGIAGVYTAIMTTGSALMTGKYELAIPVAKEEKAALDILNLCLLIALVLTGLVAMPIVCAPAFVASLLRSPALTNWMFYLPLSLLVWGAYQAFSLWCNRDGDFSPVASSRFLRSGLTVGIALILSYTMRNAGGLILAGLLGQAGALLWIYRVLSKKGVHPLRNLDPAALWQQAACHRDLPFFHASSSLIDNYALAAPLLFMNWHHGSGAAGAMNLVMLVLGTPVSIVSESVGQVFFQRATDALRRAAPIQALVRQHLLWLFAATLPVMVVLWTLSPWLFVTFFGPAWGTSGEYARWLVLPYGIRLVVSPLSLTLPAVGKVRWSATWKVVYGILASLALGIGGRSSPRALLGAVVVNDIMMYLVYLGVVVHAARLKPSGSPSNSDGEAS